MESEVLKVADEAVKQPGVTGYLCVDNKGLCLAAKGDASQSMSGIVHQFAVLASKIDDFDLQNGPSSAQEKEPPVIRVDLERCKILIQSRDSVTTALILAPK